MEKIVITKEDVIKIQKGDKEHFNYIYLKFKDIWEKTSTIFPYIKEETFTVISRRAFKLLYRKIDLEKSHDITRYILKNYNKAFKIELIKYANNNLFEIVDGYLEMVPYNKFDCLIEFLKYLKVNIEDVDIFLYFINKYPEINLAIVKLIGNKQLAPVKDLDSLTDDKMVQQFIKAFMVKNGISEEIFDDDLVICECDNKSKSDVNNNSSETLITDEKLYKGISKKEILSYGEVLELFKEYHNGNQEAYDKLFKCNLGLVRSLASYYSKYMDFDDLFQEGSLGLDKAIKKFNPNLGYQFSTYAVYWIRQAINRFIYANSSCIKTPINLFAFAKKIDKVAENYLSTHGYEATDEELAKLVGCSVAKIESARQTEVSIVSLNSLVGEEESTELGDFISDDSVDLVESFERKDLKKLVHRLLNNSNLNEKQKKVLGYRFGFYDGRVYNFTAISKIMGVTRERIRQIEASALKKLRLSKEAAKLVDYIESSTMLTQHLDDNKKNKDQNIPSNYFQETEIDIQSEDNSITGDNDDRSLKKKLY